MYLLKDVLSMFGSNGIKTFSTIFSDEVIKNSIRFDDIKEYISFMHIAKVDHAFVMEVYDEIEDYLITEEIIEKIMGHNIDETIIDCIKSEVDEYNAKINNLQLENPGMIVILCNNQGQIYSLCLENDAPIDDVELISPEEALVEIVDLHENQIIETKEKLKRTIEKQMESLKDYILSDKEFYLSTNKHLRFSYTENLFKNKMKKYKELKQYWSTPYDLPATGMRDFVEILWKEYGKKK